METVSEESVRRVSFLCLNCGEVLSFTTVEQDDSEIPCECPWCSSQNTTCYVGPEKNQLSPGQKRFEQNVELAASENRLAALVQCNRTIVGKVCALQDEVLAANKEAWQK